MFPYQNMKVAVNTKYPFLGMNTYNNFTDDDLLLNLSSPSLLIIEDSALAKSLSSIISRDGINSRVNHQL